VRILLDEQLARQLAPYLVGHDCRTVQEQSWAGLKNGALLTHAEAAGFSVLVTGDQNLQFQQNISKRRLGVVVSSGCDGGSECGWSQQQITRRWTHDASLFSIDPGGH